MLAREHAASRENHVVHEHESTMVVRALVIGFEPINSWRVTSLSHTKLATIRTLAPNPCIVSNMGKKRISDRARIHWLGVKGGFRSHVLIRY